MRLLISGLQDRAPRWSKHSLRPSCFPCFSTNKNLLLLLLLSCHYIIQKTSSFDPVILLLYTIFVCKWKLRKVAKCKQVSNYVTRVQTSRDQRANSGEAPSIGRARERDTLNQEQEVGGRRGASNNQAKIIVLAGGKKSDEKNFGEKFVQNLQKFHIRKLGYLRNLGNLGNVSHFQVSASKSGAQRKYFPTQNG